MDGNSPQSAQKPDLIPASMISDYAYCPRQCYIRWNEGEFEECEDASNSPDDSTEDSGGSVASNSKPIAGICRTVHLSAPKLGITCRINLVDGGGEGGDRNVMPVLIKKGDAAGNSGEVYESDRVRLCAQALVLRENGFLCSAGLAYFSKSRKSMPVQFDEPLIARTEEIVARIRAMAAERKMPAPLIDSPKCNRCTFGGICLPDEVNLLRELKAGKSGAYGGEGEDGRRDESLVGSTDGCEKQVREPAKELRMLLASRDDQVPVYVLDQGSTVHKRGDCLEIRSREGKVLVLWRAG